MKVLVPVLILVLLPGRASAQEGGPKAAGKAAAWSLLVPGLGHRYVNDGRWQGAAAFHALSDAGLWLSLAGVEWQGGQTIESYRTLAAGSAGASLTGKDRRFLVNLGLYRSSEDFREDHLRRRLWDRIAYVAAPGYQWKWESEEDFLRYRGLRESADTWSRRRTLVIAALAANRVLAAVTSLVAARRTLPSLSVAVSAPPPRAEWPVVRISVGF